MKAVVYRKYGGPEVLEFTELPKPQPKENEILIKIIATSVTTADVRMRKADPFPVKFMMGFPNPKKQVLGTEFSGIVEAVGSGVTRFRVNDRVYGPVGFKPGTYLEYRCFSQDSLLTVIPDNVSFEEAAAIPFGGMSSLYFLKKGKVGKGTGLLIYGASGCLGTAAIQLAVNMGADVTAVCSGKNEQLVKSLGAKAVIDYTKDSLKFYPGVFDVVFDTIGKSPFDESIKALKKGGIYLRAVHMAPGVIFRGIRAGLTSGRKVMGGTAAELPEYIDHLSELAAAGKYKPVIDKIYPLSEIRKAHEYVDSGHKRGNVVIKIDP